MSVSITVFLNRVRDVPCTTQEFRQLTGGGNQTKSITVGLLIAPENTRPVPADTGDSVLPILPVFRADISRFAKKRKRRRESKEKEKKMRREESLNVRTCEKDGVEQKRKKRRSVRCDGTHACVEKMKLDREDGCRRIGTLDENQSTKIQLDFSVQKEGDPHRSPRPRAHPKGPTREKL
ncbi:hypothetical protein HZH68_003604 [Vespula germanica]|uniref:Uncharacterized protein n=1 Tax=Vespula germanica TaxID=30212 RepID=A0A834NPR5_VESGE|nr:hypothetical protein HZH68_003604 [Vespula germanica]